MHIIIEVPVYIRIAQSVGPRAFIIYLLHCALCDFCICVTDFEVQCNKGLKLNY